MALRASLSSLAGLAVLLALVASVCVAEQLHAGVLVTSSDVQWAHLSGVDTVTIKGVGFRTYGTATCDWDGRWQSTVAYIADDNTIVCESPVIDKNSVPSLPLVAPLSVYFDGDLDTLTSVAPTFTFGPTLRNVAPVRGRVAGGELFVAEGQGWSDFLSAQVFFDGVACPPYIDQYGQRADYLDGDGMIQCQVPAGYFNQDADISIVFEGNPAWTLRSAQTYHYGPVLTGIFPSCGALQGGTTVTIFGQGLEDATISDNATPLSGPTVELLVPTSLGTTRYFGLNPVVSPIDRTITFTTPSLGTDLTFGIQATVQVFWKQVQSRAGVVKPFTYGASVDPTKLNPTHLSLGGGQLISITGCGLSQFNSSQLAVSFGSTAICNRGAGPGSSNDTLFVVPNGDGTDTLYCTQLAIGCTAPGSSYPVTVTINTLPSPIPIGTTITLPSSGTMNITVGPVVDLTTVHPTRGPRLGGTVVAVGGSGFTDSQGTPLPVVVTLSTVGSSSSTFATVNGVVVSDTQFEYTMPPGLFGLDVQASYLFGTGDANCVGGTTARASFHYGPVCSLVAPQYGRVVGGDRVTITGAGFLEDGTLPSDIDVRFCIRRLGYGLYNCSAEPHPRGDFVVTDSTLTVSTPNWRQNVATLVGGNRLFGDKADVYIYFRAPGSNTGNYGPDFNEALLAPGLQKAIIQCSSGSPYTFGPKVTNLTPNKAQSSNLPATTVVASGPGFNDAVYNAHTPLVAFGSQLGLNTAIVADATRDIQTSTIGGPTAPSNTLPTVTVTFNTCNQTTSTTSVTWGPTITAITCTTCDVAGNVLYGLDPAGGQPITIQGTRFDDFLVGATFQATCLIKNTQVPATFVSSTALTCNTPALPWSSRANVAVLFGYIPGDKVQPFNWRNAVASPIQLAYDISILAGSTTPNFGHTSGGTPVQLTVFGIGTWSTPNVIFGSYASPATFAGPNVIVAPTPLDRGDFNTDVKVYVQVGPTYFTQSPDTFHYGPVCTDVVPNNCPTTGCPSTAYLSGSGFQDCNPASTDDRSCRARFFQIEYVNADGSISVVAPVNADVTTGQNTDTKLYYVAPAVTNCNYEPKVQIRFLDAAIATNNSNQNVVQCKASGRPYFFHYGPLFVASNSAHHDASTGYEYGWIGDTVTFTVTNLNDSHIGVPLQCAFRNESNQVSFTTATVTSANTVTCPIGDGNWNSLASVSLEYAVPCEIAVGHVHYGPVLRSIAPTFGRVAGGTPVTISGFGFTCCGIFSINALFPGATNPVSFTETQLTTTVPVNQKIDLLLNNIGASFKSANFPITVGNTFSLYSTETKTSLTYYYGPVVSSIFPGQVQLSGRGQIVTITGSGFADPYFTDAFCDYIATDGSYQLLGSVKLLPNEKSDTQLLCRVLEFSHSCLAVDHISPRWRRFGDEADPLRPEQGRFYWKTVAPPAATFPVATSTDGGSAQRDLPFRLNFGFSILAVSGSLNVPTTGGSILTVTTTNLRDYYSNTSTLDFGPGQAVCVWGNYRSPITTFVPSQDGVTSTVFNCTVPAAPLGYSAPLTVIVNPNENADTTVVGGFEWLPQASSLSRSFGLSTGGDVVIVRGSGFSNYDTVTCYFGGVQAVRSDITNDFSVLCVTPYTQPGQVAVKLQFCKAGNCQQLQSLDAVTVPSPFTFIGINSIYPSAGSICGNTPVQINGYGFSYFDSVQCVFGDLKTPGVIASDSTVECKTADVSALYTVDERAAFCVVTSIIGTRAGESHVVSSSASFEYGFPQVTSVSPATGDIDNLPTLLTIRGLFFNGGKVIDTYTCKFGNIHSQAILVPTEDDDDQATILCYTPPGNQLTIGSYPVEVQFSCLYNNNFTHNRVPFQVTQTPAVSTFSPASSYELGGVDVVVTGNNFNGGTLYLCKFGDTIVSGRFNNGALTPIPIPAPLPVDQYVDYFEGLLPDDDLKRSVGRRSVLGTGDTITCRAPYHPVDTNTFVDLSISIDGGQTWAYARDRFLYENILGISQQYCNRFVVEEDVQAVSANSASSFAVPMALIAALMFMLLA